MAAALYCDPPPAALFKALAFPLKFDSRARFTSIHAQTSVAAATWKGFLTGVQTGMQGDPRQQGGAVVLTARGARAGGEEEEEGGGIASDAPASTAALPPLLPAVTWVHRDRHNADQALIPVLLAAAGAPEGAYVHGRHVAAASAATAAAAAQ